LELEELGSIREMQVKESEASGKISGLEKKIQYADIEKVTSMINLCIIFSFLFYMDLAHYFLVPLLAQHYMGIVKRNLGYIFLFF
jgi:hypothetical protein